MIDRVQLKYLLDDVICMGSNHRLEIYSISSDMIMIQIGECEYQEPVFDFFSPQLSPGDIDFLNEIEQKVMGASLNVDSLLEMRENLSFQSSSYLKIIHFFVAEHYLDSDVPLDKHGRVVTAAVRDEYRKYLEFPVVDILVFLFFKNCKVSVDFKKKVYFTCDYDILNFWGELGVKGVMSRTFKSIKKLEVKKLWNESKSLLLSKQVEKYNYFLNDEMFFYETCKNAEIKNIAFWLLLKSHELDCENDLKNAVVQGFIQSLSTKGVCHGIHPNYVSAEDKEVFQKQVTIFKEIFHKAPELGRYHYLHCKFPKDYKCLEEQGIKEDFTYTFPDGLIFRGGRSKEVRLWNDEVGTSYQVISWPLTIMDGTLNDYLKLDYEEALTYSRKKILYSLVLGSCCDLLWHNRSMYIYGTENNYHPKLIKELQIFVKQILTNLD